MNERLIKDFNEKLIVWAKQKPEIAGILLVGSYARGEEQADSDIDIVILSENKEELTVNTGWISIFGMAFRMNKEKWGIVTSLRVAYEKGMEVEFVISGPEWAAISPIDTGTRQVVEKGAKIIWDPQGILFGLINSVTK